MPSKSRRAASRQARLNRRKRRTKVRERPVAPESESTATTAPIAETSQVSTPARRPARTASAPVAQAAETPSPVRRRRSRQAAAGPEPAYKHLGSELRRIGVLLTMLVAVLVVLSFVLR
jgi:hypothetical protein